LSLAPVQLPPSSDLRWGGTAYPVGNTMSVRVRPGRLSSVLAAYGSIESGADRMLAGRVLAVGGDPTDPSWIKLPRAQHPAVGTVLVSRPTERLPAGLFHVVTATRLARRAVWIGLRPARVLEAYPRLYLDRAMSTQPVLSRTAGLTCPGLQVHVQPRLVADKFRATSAGVQGTLLTRLTGAVELNVSATGASSCQSDPGSTAAWRGFASVAGGVPIPYFIQPRLGVQWRSSGAFAFATKTPLALTAGARFTASAARPVLSGRPQPNGSLAHDGDVRIGAWLQARIGLGTPNQPLASVQVRPVVSGQTGPCSLGTQTDLAARSDAGGHPVALQTTAPALSAPCPRRTLTVSATGTGAGDVTSVPNGIDCGAQCSTAVDSGSHVTLTATPSSSRFDGWSGGGCSGTGPCTVQVAGDTNVTANFSQPTLTVGLSGAGSGTVTTADGLSCPGACSRHYPIGSSVSLVATPSPGSAFTGWSGGGCSGVGRCTVPIGSTDSSVTANFAPDVSATARAKLLSLLEAVPDATGSSYETRDSTGATVDTIKIIASPGGGYLGVYHTNVSGQFEVRLGTSPDLTHWTYVTTLDSDASQPTIAQLSDGSFLVADEHAMPDGSSHLRFTDYADLSSLRLGIPARIFNAPLALSALHEGTPNIRSATVNGSLSDSQIEVGFHYYDSTVPGDREGVGTLVNFSSWSAHPNQDLNSAFDPMPATIGDRDFIDFEGYPFTVVEGQTVAGDWGSWRLYLYDETAKSITPIQVKTAGGSQSFGNPTVTLLTDPAGHPALVASYFIFSSDVAPGEAGPLIFWTEY
jgi:hypothetical protein